MKKSKLFALVLATLVLIAALPGAFAAEETGTIPGGSTVNDVTIDVVVPANINFALDPLELDAIEGSQISTTDYFFINKTPAPVKIELDITTTLVDGVTLVDDAAALSKDDPSVTDKKLYFAALGATAITANDLVFDYVMGTEGSEDPVGTYAADAATLAAFDAESGAASLWFALDMATASVPDGAIDTLAASGKGVAAFQFLGELNTYAAWATDDVKVSGAYTLIALRTSTYDAYTTESSFTTGGVNQLTIPAPEPEPTPTPTPTPTPIVFDGAGFIVNEATVTTLADAVTNSKASTTDISIPFFADGLTATSLKIAGTFTIPADEYALVDDTLVLYKADETNVFRTAGNGTKAMTLTLSDTSTYTFNVTVTD